MRPVINIHISCINQTDHIPESNWINALSAAPLSVLSPGNGNYYIMLAYSITPTSQPVIPTFLCLLRGWPNFNQLNAFEHKQKWSVVYWNATLINIRINKSPAILFLLEAYHKNDLRFCHVFSVMFWRNSKFNKVESISESVSDSGILKWKVPERICD